MKEGNRMNRGTRHIIAILAASAALFSCTKQEQPESVSEARVFTANIEQGMTRTVIADEFRKVEWVSGDLIKINGAVYTATPGDPATKAQFNYKSGAHPQPPYSAIFPASLKGGNGQMAFPDTLIYRAGEFNAPMYAESSTEHLSFSNLCGVLCFSLKGKEGSESVKSISITANNEGICGPFQVTKDNNVYKAVIDGGRNTVTLDCGEGVTLNQDDSTNFFMFLPPWTYSEGMVITITGTDPEKLPYVRKTVTEAEVKRNSFYIFDWSVDFKNPDEPVPPEEKEIGLDFNEYKLEGEF